MQRWLVLSLSLSLSLSLTLLLARTQVDASTRTTCIAIYKKGAARTRQNARELNTRCAQHGSRQQDDCRDSREKINSFAMDDGYYTRRETDSIRAARKRTGAQACLEARELRACAHCLRAADLNRDWCTRYTSYLVFTLVCKYTSIVPALVKVVYLPLQNYALRIM